MLNNTAFVSMLFAELSWADYRCERRCERGAGASALAEAARWVGSIRVRACPPASQAPNWARRRGKGTGSIHREAPRAALTPPTRSVLPTLVLTVELRNNLSVVRFREIRDTKISRSFESAERTSLAGRPASRLGAAWCPGEWRAVLRASPQTSGRQSGFARRAGTSGARANWLG